MSEYRGKNNDEWVNVVIPNRLYDEEGLNYFLTRHFNSSLDRCPISISSNLVTMKFTIILKENYSLSLNYFLNKFGLIVICVLFLRFENGAELSSKYNEATKVPNTTRNVDKIHIHSSLVGS